MRLRQMTDEPYPEGPILTKQGVWQSLLADEFFGTWNLFFLRLVLTDRIIVAAGCECLESFSWEGQTVSGSDGAQCTTLDWPVPWCATKKRCVKIRAHVQLVH
jgi:hypothetical protein